MAPAQYPCLHCGNPFEPVAAYSLLPRVTSDSKPFRAGGEIGSCGACGLVQKPATDALLADIADVYRDYAMFSQSSGLSEQAIFSNAGHTQSARSGAVVACLRQNIRLPAQGKLLDVGCGTGPFLGAFAKALPFWRLHAQDLDGRYRQRLSCMDNFEKLHVCEVGDIGDTFDVIALSHSLEHFIDPMKMLRTLGGLLNRQGAIAVQIPDLAENVFDLTVCDHRSHFTADTLVLAARAAGFAPANIKIWRGIVPKQLTMILSREDVWTAKGGHLHESLPYDLRQGIRTLYDYQEAYRHFVSRHDEIAVFGVATAATWFATIDRTKMSFFVDEDKSRIGSSHLGIPVVSPGELPRHIPVFVGLAPAKAQGIICARLAAQGLISQGAFERERACA